MKSRINTGFFRIQKPISIITFAALPNEKPTGSKKEPVAFLCALVVIVEMLHRTYYNFTLLLRKRSPL